MACYLGGRGGVRAAHLAEGVWGEFIQKASHFPAFWGDEEPRWGFWQDSLWDLKNCRSFLVRKIQKPRSDIRGPGQGSLCVMGVGPGVIEGSPGRTGPEMGAGLECEGPALRPDQDLPIPTCQPGFPEQTWTEWGARPVLPISPKVAPSKAIHWVLWLGQQRGSPAHPTNPAETSGTHRAIHPCGQDQTSQKRWAHGQQVA